MEGHDNIEVMWVHMVKQKRAFSTLCFHLFFLNKIKKTQVIQVRVVFSE